MKIGFCSALFLVFLVLKLTDTIDWSWWWITAPLWGDFILSVVFGVIAIRIKKAEQKEEEEFRALNPRKISRFMEKLEQAMAESKERRDKIRDN